MTSTDTKKRPRRKAREPKIEATLQIDGGDTHALASGGETDAPAPDRAGVDTSLRTPSKSELVLDLLRRKEGATIEELVAATGWLPHSARASLTGLRKKGYAIERNRIDGVTRYRETSGQS